MINRGVRGVEDPEARLAAEAEGVGKEIRLPAGSIELSEGQWWPKIDHILEASKSHKNVILNPPPSQPPDHSLHSCDTPRSFPQLSPPDHYLPSHPLTQMLGPGWFGSGGW